jgi:ABC-type nitrate/sulfonate/bicarbonate transport system substrate-binding protein
MLRPPMAAAVLVCLSVFAAACGGSSSSSNTTTSGGKSTGATASKPEAGVFRMGIEPWLGYGPWRIAQEKGIFAKNGLKVKIINFATDDQINSAFASGKLDGTNVATHTALRFVAQGLPLKAVLLEDVSLKADAILSGPAIKSIKDLKGKKVGIWPGSTQEVFIMERLKMEGLTIKDVSAVRVPFGEMPTMLQRGDIDAYVDAEPAPGLSISTGAGQLVEYPYSTAMGGLNMIFATHADTVANNPDLVKAMLKTQRQAAEFMAANIPAVIDASVQKLGANRAAVEQALGAKNVEYIWKLDGTVVGQAKTYAQHMLDLKQIRALPKFETFLNPKFSNELANS